MAYTKKVWKQKPDTSTPLSASNLNHLEDGLEAAAAVADSAASTASAAAAAAAAAQGTANSAVGAAAAAQATATSAASTAATAASNAATALSTANNAAWSSAASANISGGASVTIGSNEIFPLVLTGNVTSFTVSGAPSAGRATLLLKQDATGGRSFAFPGSWNWVGAPVPLINLTANVTTVIELLFSGGVTYAWVGRTEAPVSLEGGLITSSLADVTIASVGKTPYTTDPNAWYGLASLTLPAGYANAGDTIIFRSSFTVQNTSGVDVSIKQRLKVGGVVHATTGSSGSPTKDNIVYSSLLTAVIMNHLNVELSVQSSGILTDDLIQMFAASGSSAGSMQSMNASRSLIHTCTGDINPAIDQAISWEVAFESVGSGINLVRQGQSLYLLKD